MTAYLTFVHVLSSLHAGTGQGSGIIDLPIAREKATNLPYLPGSSLKGALRTSCGKEVEVPLPDNRKKTVESKLIFGSEEIGTTATTAGTVQISDQHLLLLPVRSLAGTFAWVTSPYVLHRLARDMVELSFEKMDVPHITNTHQANIVTDEAGSSSCQLFANAAKNQIYLEDLDLQANKDSSTRKWADWLGRQIFPAEQADWRSMLCERFCIVHDDVFDFLLKTATEIIARIHLDEGSKTVQKGGLWYEEMLPTETILCGLALTTPRAKSDNGSQSKQDTLTSAELDSAFQHIARRSLQLGGKSTVGHGRCRVCVVANGSAKHANS